MKFSHLKDFLTMTLSQFSSNISQFLPITQNEFTLLFHSSRQDFFQFGPISHSFSFRYRTSINLVLISLETRVGIIKFI